MHRRSILGHSTVLFVIALLFSHFTATPAPAADGDPASPVQELLQAGDFSGALQLYADAVRVAPDNQELRQRHAILRQVTALRELLGKEHDASRWEQAAGALRAFYWDEGLLRESLVLDTRWHQRDASAETAARLAKTQLELGMNAEAETTLAGMIEDQSPIELRLLYGIALARQSRIEPARAVLASLSLSDGTAPEPRYHLARLQALAGEREAAQQSLTQVLAATAPSQQAALRDRAKACPDFSVLAETTTFAQVLATKSQIKESSCSTGKTCGGCPRATACSGASKTKALGTDD
ncbi:MAG: hypothetical protein KAY32_09445 [Candidatus Eisenbacteria sp.]|nr:hypothetical protein [Candidatus Eisenbacteria bacterium]